MPHDARERWIAVVGQGRGGTSPLYYATVDALHAAGHKTLRTYEKYRRGMFRNIAQRDRDRWVVAKFLSNHPPFGEDLLERFGRRIQIARDPRDSLVSVMLFTGAHLARRSTGRRRVQKLIDMLEAKEHDPSSVTLTALLDVALAEGLQRDMPAFLERRYRQPIALHERTGMTVVRLEDLVAGRTAAAEAVVGVPLELRRPPAAKAHVLRSGTPSWSRWFLAEDVERLRPVLLPFMEHFGYADDWTLDPHPRIDPKESSSYVRSTHDAIAQREAHGADPPLDLLRYRGSDGCPKAAYRAAVRLAEAGHDLAEARDLAVFAASTGRREAMRLAARMLADGTGGPVDLDEARYWRAEGSTWNYARRRLRRRVRSWVPKPSGPREEQLPEGVATSG